MSADPLPDHSTRPCAFVEADLDGDTLAIDFADQMARSQYNALLAVDGGSMYLDRRQVERLRDFLNTALAFDETEATQ